MAKYEMKYMYDFGSECCIWSLNDDAKERYGYLVLSEQLPISKELKSKLNHLISIHEEALDWGNPQGDLLWSEKQIQLFRIEAITAYDQLCNELGGEYEVSLWSDYLI